MAVEIKISELKTVLNRILDHIEHEVGRESIQLNKDSYWEVASNERYEFTKAPENLEHGQLQDDWGFLSSILRDKDQAVAFMLVHMAPLLRYLGEEVSQ